MSSIVTTETPGTDEPSPEIERLTSRIRSAVEGTPGRYSISSRSAPSDRERQALTRRADELRVGLTPAEAKDIAAEVLKLLAGYPSLRLTHEEAARTAATFVAALSGLPLWAIRRACLDWARGRVKGSNPAFPPSAPELRGAADMAARPRLHEAGTIRVALEAKPDDLPTDEERQRAVARWHDEIRPTMQRADVTSDIDRQDRERAAFVDASDRLRRRERAAAGADPEVPHTIRMERDLAGMAAQRANQMTPQQQEDEVDAEG